MPYQYGDGTRALFSLPAHIGVGLWRMCFHNKETRVQKALGILPPTVEKLISKIDKGRIICRK